MGGVSEQPPAGSFNGETAGDDFSIVAASLSSLRRMEQKSRPFVPMAICDGVTHQPCLVRWYRAQRQDRATVGV